MNTIIFTLILLQYIHFKSSTLHVKPDSLDVFQTASKKRHSYSITVFTKIVPLHEVVITLIIRKSEHWRCTDCTAVFMPGCVWRWHDAACLISIFISSTFGRLCGLCGLSGFHCVEYIYIFLATGLIGNAAVGWSLH